MSNSNLLKEAIADAKAVRATALANAKISLAESFNNRFSAVFADKLREDSEREEAECELEPAELELETTATPELPLEENEAVEEEETIEEDMTEETITNEDLDEIIRELEDESNVDPEGDALAGTNLPATEPEGEPAPEETGEDESDEIKSGDSVVISKVTPPAAAPATQPAPVADMGTEPAPEGDDEIDLTELLASLNEEAADDIEELDAVEEVEEQIDPLAEVTAERDQAYETVSYLKAQLNEINLLNAKLLYTNKLFKQFGMNRDHKTKIVESFDLTKNVREVKLTYANWCESLNFGGNVKIRKSPAPAGVTTITEGLASKSVASTKPTKEVITPSGNAMASRFQKLAGIVLKK